MTTQRPVEDDGSETLLEKMCFACVWQQETKDEHDSERAGVQTRLYRCGHHQSASAQPPRAFVRSPQSASRLLRRSQRDHVELHRRGVSFHEPLDDLDRILQQAVWAGGAVIDRPRFATVQLVQIAVHSDERDEICTRGTGQGEKEETEQTSKHKREIRRANEPTDAEVVPQRAAQSVAAVPVCLSYADWCSSHHLHP